MPQLQITNAGRAAAIDADNNGMTVRMAQIAVGTGQYSPTRTQTTLQTQVAIADVTRALEVGTDQIQVSAVFDSDSWDASEMGVFLDDGTLFAVGSSMDSTEWPTKTAGNNLVASVTVLISDVPSGSVTVDASIQATIPQASETEAGITEYADDSEADDNANNTRSMTPEQTHRLVEAAVTNLVGAAPAALDTIAELAAALNNNPNILDSLTAYARLNGAVFTGAVQVPNRPDGDNTGHVANTRFVHDVAEGLETMIEQSAGVVLAEDISLTAGARTTHALAQPFDDFRWIRVIWGEAAGQINYNGGDILTIPRGDVGARALDNGTLFALLETSSNQVQLFSVSRTTGAFTAIGNAHAQNIIESIGLTWDGIDILALLEVSGSQVQLFEINRTTGALLPRGNPQDRVVTDGIGLQWHNGGLYALIDVSNTHIQTYRVDRLSGVLSEVGPQQAHSNSRALALASDENELFALFEASANQLQLFVVNTTTGILAPRGAQQAQAVVSAVGMTWDGSNMYAVLEVSDGQLQTFLIDRTTGALTARGNAHARTLGNEVGIAADFSVSGAVIYDHLQFDRNGASSLGITATRDRYIAQVIGIP